jgi:hypothetical protein
MNFSFNQSDYYKINQNNNIRNIYAYQQNIINPYIIEILQILIMAFGLIILIISLVQIILIQIIIII